MKKIYKVKNMTCSACVSKIEKTLNENNIKGKVNLMSEKLSVDAESLNEQEIKKIMRNIGYDIYNNDENTDEKVNIYLIGILSLINMIIAMNMYINTGIIEFFITTVVMFLSRHILKDAFLKLKSLSFNMNTLISLGAISAYFYSTYNLFISNYHHLYFEGVTMILFVVILGKKIEQRLKKNTNEAIEKIGELIPTYSEILINNEIKKVLTKDINIGDIVILKEGQIATVDGIIVSGCGSFDENMITGESIYVDKSKNDEVLASTILVNGQINMKATKVGEETVISKIKTIVELSTDVKPDIARFADKIASIFVPTILFIAIVTAIVWYLLTKDFYKAFNHFVVILVIACPCAVGLATPASITVAIGLLAKNNILIKNARILEYAYKITDIFLDKTGTLTEGKPVVIYSDLEKYEDLNMVYNIERYIEHPISKSIVNYVKNKISVENIELKVRNYQGLGVSSNEYIIGNETLMLRKKINIDRYKDKYSELSKEGKTVIFISKNNEVISILALIDDIKESSYEYINKNRKNKINFTMLTGDNEKTSNYIAKKLNISNVISQVLPYEKSNYVELNQSKEKVIAMVGDGVNDAPALAMADIGIAVSSGTDIAIKSCDVILMSNNLNDIDKLIKISKYTSINIKQNFFWGFIYNIFGIVVATGVVGIELTPMMASLFMILSSISVLINAIRLKWNKDILTNL